MAFLLLRLWRGIRELGLSLERVVDDVSGELGCGCEGEGLWEEECIWVLGLWGGD